MKKIEDIGIERSPQMTESEYIVSDCAIGGSSYSLWPTPTFIASNIQRYMIMSDARNLASSSWCFDYDSHIE